MGANAQTTVPSFTALQVLTAAELNLSARTGVPVFADATARDAAFGGSGEKTLAEGQLAYLEDIDVAQYYDGSNWRTLGPTPQPGLELISSTTIGSAVSSVTVSNVFSATYDNYKIIISGGVASTATFLKLTLGATTSGYYYAGLFTGSNWGSTLTGDAGSNVAFFAAGGGTTTSLSGAIELFAPNLAKATTFNAIYSDMRTTGSQQFYGGYLNDSTQYTAFTLTTGTGTVTGGTIKVYGYKN